MSCRVYFFPIRYDADTASDPFQYTGRCYHQAPQVDSLTRVTSRERLSPGELVRCTIVASDGYDLIARPTAELESATRLPVIGQVQEDGDHA